MYFQIGDVVQFKDGMNGEFSKYKIIKNTFNGFILSNNHSYTEEWLLKNAIIVEFSANIPNTRTLDTMAGIVNKIAPVIGIEEYKKRRTN